jgi:uncharacterized protein (TIGR00251 family)
MKLKETSEGVVLDVNVKPNSKQFRVVVESNEFMVSCREAPVKSKVNRELIKELSRVFKARVEILSGFASRHKKILIRNISTEEANKILSAYTQ